MPHASRQPAVFGPFDGDFDPFEDEEEFGVLITFGRTVAAGDASGPLSSSASATRSKSGR